MLVLLFFFNVHLFVCLLVNFVFVCLAWLQSTIEPKRVTFCFKRGFTKRHSPLCWDLIFVVQATLHRHLTGPSAGSHAGWVHQMLQRSSSRGQWVPSRPSDDCPVQPLTLTLCRRIFDEFKKLKV